MGAKGGNKMKKVIAVVCFLFPMLIAPFRVNAQDVFMQDMKTLYRGSMDQLRMMELAGVKSEEERRFERIEKQLEKVEQELEGVELVKQELEWMREDLKSIMDELKRMKDKRNE